MVYHADTFGQPPGQPPGRPPSMPPPPGMAPPPYGSPPQIVYVQSPTPHIIGHSAQSVDKLTVPLLLFISSVAFIGWASWFGTTSINSIQSNIKDISTTLTNFIAISTERVDRIEQALERRTAERWTKSDQELFCAKTESIPGNKGWRCAETDNGYMRVDGPPIWDHASRLTPYRDQQTGEKPAILDLKEKTAKSKE